MEYDGRQRGYYEAFADLCDKLKYVEYCVGRPCWSLREYPTKAQRQRGERYENRWQVDETSYGGIFPAL